MPYRIEHGGLGLLTAAAQAGKAVARQRRYEGEQRVALATVAAKQRKDEALLRSKAFSLQSAAATRAATRSAGFRERELSLSERREERFETEGKRQAGHRDVELGLKQRGAGMAERREARYDKTARDKQAVITEHTQQALDWLDGELASGQIDDRGHRTAKIGILTGNNTLVSTAFSQFSKTRMADEKARATAMEEVERLGVALNAPQATLDQRKQAAQSIIDLQSDAESRWGQDWKDRPMEFYAPNTAPKYKNPAAASLASAKRAGQVVKAWPVNRKDLEIGVAYPVPSQGGVLHVFTGSRLRRYGDPVAEDK